MSNLHANSFEDFQSMTEWDDSEEDDFDEASIDFAPEAFDLAEQLHGFLLRTPELTDSEQAELLGAFVEDARRAGGRPSGEVDWGRVAQGVQTGLSLFQTGAQIAGGIAGAFGGNNRTARDISLWSRRLGQGAGFAQNIFGNIRPGQTPRLPTGVQRIAQAGRPYLRRITTPAAPTGRPSPGQTRPVAGTGAPGRLPLNNTAQFASLLNNPQIMQALRSALFRGREGALRVEADISNSTPESIPLGDVMVTIARLAQESALELNALAGEGAVEIPSYLVSEDGEYIVDPESAEDRDALVLENLRRQGELGRYDDLGGYVAMDGVAGNEMDESEVWAREAGFDG
jgi:hypothetical protein